MLKQAYIVAFETKKKILINIQRAKNKKVCELTFVCSGKDKRNIIYIFFSKLFIIDKKQMRSSLKP